MNDLAEEVRRLLTVVVAQQRSIQQLTELLARRSPPEPGRPDGSAATARPGRPVEPDGFLRRPIDWNMISGRERLAAWEGLAAFVEDFVLRYSLQFEVLACWWRHKDAVELLTAMWQVYQTSYDQDGTDPNAAMTWLNHYYTNANRLKGIFVSCREEHVDATPKVWMTPEIRRDFLQSIHRESQEPTAG